jgi:hypothetical protein
LWLVMESVCGTLWEKRVALFSDNSPTVGWVRRLATRGYMVSAHFIRALALQLKLNRTCPVTPLHIAGEENSMTDIPSRSFGSKPKWHCKSHTDLLTLFNNLFPIPSQNSWTLFQISYAVGMQVTSVLQMKDFTLEEWRRLPKVGKHVGAAGRLMSHLWEWTLFYRTPRSLTESASSQASQDESVQATTVKENGSKLEASLTQSRPLARRLLWPRIPVPQIVGSDKLMPRLQQMLDGFRKADPPTTKQLPVEADVPEFLVQLGLSPEARELDRAIGDLTMIAFFYYLLRIGEYTTKGTCNNSKQTEEFKMGDITFFAKDKQGNLRCLPRDATVDLIAEADGTTNKLDNQKNGWKGVSVYQEANGDPLDCPVRALG